MLYFLLGGAAVIGGGIIDLVLLPQTYTMDANFRLHSVIWMAIGAFVGWCAKKAFE